MSHDPGNDDIDDEGIFPWKDVIASRNRRRSSFGPKREEEGRAIHLAHASPCPGCNTPAADLAWIWFESPEWTWERLCGRAGWRTVCDACRRQVDFFLDILN